MFFEADMKSPTAAELAFEAANAQRKLCRDWLIYIMTSSPTKTRTKADLCNEAMRRFKVSKGSFDAGWTWAIEATGQHDWYEPLRRRTKKADPQRKTPILNQ